MTKLRRASRLFESAWRSQVYPVSPMRRLVLAVLITGLLAACGEVRAPVEPAEVTTVITFDELSVDNSPFLSYSQSGFSVTPLSDWKARTNRATSDPFVASIAFEAPRGETRTGEVRIARDRLPFRFLSVDLYSSTIPIPYRFRGFRGGTAVFTVEEVQPHMFGNSVRVLNPYGAEVIDSLLITLTNPAAPCCENPMGVDNIAVVATNH